MSTLTKLALGLLGAVRTRPAEGASRVTIRLPAPDRTGGAPLMQALAMRQSSREFDRRPLTRQQLSNVLWGAFGVNRTRGHGRTAPSAVNAQEIEVYAALPEGLYLYDPDGHSLERVLAVDARPLTGRQEFVDDAPVDLVYVADYSHMTLISPADRERYAAADAGFIGENVYLVCASEGLATVVRGLIDRDALHRAMGLRQDQHIVLAQTIGYPRA